MRLANFWRLTRAFGGRRESVTLGVNCPAIPDQRGILGEGEGFTALTIADEENAAPVEDRPSGTASREDVGISTGIT